MGLVYENESVEEYEKEKLKINPNWNCRDFVHCVNAYINASAEKILAIGGLQEKNESLKIKTFIFYKQ